MMIFKLAGILTSRSKYDLSLFFEKCPKKEREAVRHVTIDMRKPYKETAFKWLPNAVIAVDPFHVIEHLGNCFTRIRIRIMDSRTYGSNSCYLLKTWHKLPESDKCILDGPGKHNHISKGKLNYGDIKKMLLEPDDELALACELKEIHGNFSFHSAYETASGDPDVLISSFEKANIKEYEESVDTVIRWKKEIINQSICYFR